MLKQVVVGPFQCNCRLLVCEQTGQGVLVDPGDEPQKILKMIQDASLELGRNIDIKMFLHTHAHLDHVGATRSLKFHLNQSEVALHREDESLYLKLQDQGRLFGMQLDAPVPVTRYLEDQEILSVGQMKIEVRHTPGHSPGGVCLYCQESSGAGVPEAILTGDTLFKESVGRTDLWGGDFELLKTSIRNRIYELSDHVQVLAGHGEDSSVGFERKHNPYVTG